MEHVSTSLDNATIEDGDLSASGCAADAQSDAMRSTAGGCYAASASTPSKSDLVGNQSFDCPSKSYSNRPPPSGTNTTTLIAESGTAREAIENGARKLIAEINTNRKQHADVLQQYRKALDAQAERKYAAVENVLFAMYESHSKQIEEKLQQLFATLKRVSDLETELEQFKQTTAAFCQEMSK